MWITSSLNTVLTPTAVALGNFDGLHRGHRQVIQPILKQALDLDSSAASGLNPDLQKTQADSAYQPPRDKSSAGISLRAEETLTGIEAEACYGTLVTFHPHPQEFFTGQPKQLLSPIDEKIESLKLIGVEQLVLLPFDQKLAALTPEQFVQEILVKHLQARRVSVGFDFRFGKGRKGSAEDLQVIAANSGINVTIVARYPCEQGERISSSIIRQALQQGNVKRATQLLGHSYRLVGQVVLGQQLGRTLGFPTANLQLPPEKFLPRYGVYAVRVFLQGQPSAEKTYSGVMNIGCRPTVEGQHPTVEVHLFDWSGDLYNQTLTVSLEEFLRPEQKFASLDELKAQITEDCIRSKKMLNNKE